MIHKILMTIMLMLCTVSAAFAERKVPMKFEATGSQKGEIPELNIQWEADLKAKGENSYTFTLKLTNAGGGTYILFGQSIDQNILKKNYSIKYDKFFSGDFGESQKQRVTTQTGNLRTNDPFKFLRQNETVEICYENIENEVSGRELKVACYKAVTQKKKKLFGVSREWNILQVRSDITFVLDVKIPVHDYVLERLETETAALLSELGEVKICPNKKHTGGEDGQKKPHLDKIEKLKSKIEAAKNGRDNAEEYEVLIDRLKNFKFKTKDCGKHKKPIPDPIPDPKPKHSCGYCNMSWDQLASEATKIQATINKENASSSLQNARGLKACADKNSKRQSNSGLQKKFYDRITDIEKQAQKLK